VLCAQYTRRRNSARDVCSDEAINEAGWDVIGAQVLAITGDDNRRGGESEAEAGSKRPGLTQVSHFGRPSTTATAEAVDVTELSRNPARWNKGAIFLFGPFQTSREYQHNHVRGLGEGSFVPSRPANSTSRIRPSGGITLRQFFKICTDCSSVQS
jgi:hypothetical protein